MRSPPSCSATWQAACASSSPPTSAGRTTVRRWVARRWRAGGEAGPRTSSWPTRSPASPGCRRAERSAAEGRLLTRLEARARARQKAKSRPEAAFGGFENPSYFIAPELALMADEAAELADEAA